MLIHIILQFGRESFELQNMDFFRVFLASGHPNPPSRQDGARPGSSKEKSQRAQAGARDRRPQSDPLRHLHLLICCQRVCQHNHFHNVLKVTVDELCKRWKTNVEHGLTDAQACGSLHGYMMLATTVILMMIAEICSCSERSGRARPQCAHPSTHHSRVGQVLQVTMMLMMIIRLS